MRSLDQRPLVELADGVVHRRREHTRTRHVRAALLGLGLSRAGIVAVATACGDRGGRLLAGALGIGRLRCLRRCRRRQQRFGLFRLDAGRRDAQRRAQVARAGMAQRPFTGLPAAWQVRHGFQHDPVQRERRGQRACEPRQAAGGRCSGCWHHAAPATAATARRRYLSMNSSRQDTRLPTNAAGGIGVSSERRVSSASVPMVLTAPPGQHDDVDAHQDRARDLDTRKIVRRARNEGAVRQAEEVDVRVTSRAAGVRGRHVGREHDGAELQDRVDVDAFAVVRQVDQPAGVDCQVRAGSVATVVTTVRSSAGMPVVENCLTGTAVASRTFGITGPAPVTLKLSRSA